MNSAVAVLLIFIIFVGAFTGLGFQFSNTQRLVNEYQVCQSNVAQMQKEADLQRTALTQAQARVDELTSQTKDLTLQNSDVTRQLTQANADITRLTTQLNDSLTRINILQQTSAGKQNFTLSGVFAPAAYLGLLVMSGKKLQRWLHLRKHNHLVTLELTREQVKLFAQFMRQQGRQAGTGTH